MKRISFCILFIVVIVISCGQSYEEKQKISIEERNAQKKEDSLALKIATLPTIDCMPLFVAKECGLFDTQQVDVRLHRNTAQMDCDTAFISGSVEGCVSDIIRSERMAKGGTPILYFTKTGLYWQLITNKTTRIKEVKQLGDKMVAMTRYSATDYLTNHALSGVKTSSKVFSVQINDILLRLNMLHNNEMDAMWLPEPQATKARIMNGNVISDSRDLKTDFGVIVFRSKSVSDKRRKQQLEKFNKAYNMACDSLNKNGLQHYSMIIKKYCNSDDKTIEALPKIKFNKTTKPKTEEISKAREFLQTLY